jgi:hypothetical protein
VRKLLSWTASAEDWINPVAVKEFRQAVQSRWVMAVLMLFLGINLIIVGGFLATSPDAAVSAGHGRDMFGGLLVLLMLTCMGFVPLYAGLRLSLERNDANIDLLFITTIRPAGIVRGKYFSAMALTLLIFSACMPFMVLTYLLGGVDLPTIFLLLAISYAACAVANALGICAGAVSGSWLFRCLAAGGVLFCLCYLGAGVISAIMEQLMRGRWLGAGSPSEFWGALGSIALLAVLAIGLLYVLSVALLSPKLSNRMLVPRLYLVSTWLITGGLMFFWGWLKSDIGPVEAWMVGSGIVWMITAVAAMSERDAWTTRVRRTIPRNPLLQSGAFLLYTGSAGGLIWSTLMFIATIVAAFCVRGWLALDSAARAVYYAGRYGDQFYEATANLSIVFGYVLCYCLTMAFLRMNVFRRLPLETLSLFTVIIGAFAWIVPYLLTFMLVKNWWQEPPWYLLFSPMVLTTSQGSVASAAAPVVFGWLVLGILGAFPWAYQQRRKFLPLEQK